MTEKITSDEPGRASVLSEHFVDPVGLLRARRTSLREAFSGAAVVLDTNVLLDPYNLASTSFKVVVEALAGLANEGRLVIPAHALREFLRKRGKLLADVRSGVQQKITSSAAMPVPNYPMLSGLASVEAAEERYEAAAEALSEYRSALMAIRDEVDSWQPWDPVVTALQPVIDRAEVPDLVSYDSVDAEFDRRLRERRPPGYCDEGKADSGVGDYVIWKTILEHVRGAPRDIVFVTGETKPDWVYRANKEAVAPRAELVSEFFQCSGGHTFFIASLSDLLAGLEVDDDVVEDVRSVEELEQVRRDHQEGPLAVECVLTEDVIEIENATTLVIDVTNPRSRRTGPITVAVRVPARPAATLAKLTPDADFAGRRVARWRLPEGLTPHTRSTFRAVVVPTEAGYGDITVGVAEKGKSHRRVLRIPFLASEAD